jgi:hypothetical protein
MKLPRCVNIVCLIPTTKGGCGWSAGGEIFSAFERMIKHQKKKHGEYDK